MLDCVEKRKERMERRQADDEKAQLDHLNKIFSRQRAVESMAGEIRKLHSAHDFKAEFEIASAAEIVKEAEKTAERARETGSAQDVIEHAEETVRKVRKELEVKRTDWAGKRAVIRHIIGLLEDVQYEWPLAPETDQAP